MSQPSTFGEAGGTRTAVKLAIDERDLARAHALLDLLLLAKPPVAPVVTLVRRKPLR